jgi:protein involved in polysaccharide export with SLBB domain
MKILILTALLLVAGCAGRSGAPVFTELAQTEKPPQLQIISLGDRISVASGTGPESPAFVDVIVDEEGCIELPRIGKVRVLGMNGEEACSKIWQAYRDQGLSQWWRPPCRSPTFEVMGEVTHPGKQAYLSRIRLSQAIESCDGLTRSSRRGKLVIWRSDGSIEHYEYNRIVKSPASDPEVRPGDIIEVK